jgi:hypothetical protein
LPGRHHEHQPAQLTSRDTLEQIGEGSPVFGTTEGQCASHRFARPAALASTSMS